jgi:hypothetical protein
MCVDPAAVAVLVTLAGREAEARGASVASAL